MNGKEKGKKEVIVVRPGLGRIVVKSATHTVVDYKGRRLYPKKKR